MMTLVSIDIRQALALKYPQAPALVFWDPAQTIG